MISPSAPPGARRRASASASQGGQRTAVIHRGTERNGSAPAFQAGGPSSSLGCLSISGAARKLEGRDPANGPWVRLNLRLAGSRSRGVPAVIGVAAPDIHSSNRVSQVREGFPLAVLDSRASGIPAQGVGARQFFPNRGRMRIASVVAGTLPQQVHYLPVETAGGPSGPSAFFQVTA